MFYFHLMLIVIPCSFHSSYSRLVISGNLAMPFGSLNLPSLFLSLVILWTTWEDFEVLKYLIFFISPDVLLNIYNFAMFCSVNPYFITTAVADINI